VVFIEVARVLGRQSINGNRDGPFIGKNYFDSPEGGGEGHRSPASRSRVSIANDTGGVPRRSRPQDATHTSRQARQFVRPSKPTWPRRGTAPTTTSARVAESATSASSAGTLPAVICGVAAVRGNGRWRGYPGERRFWVELGPLLGIQQVTALSAELPIVRRATLGGSRPQSGQRPQQANGCADDIGGSIPQRRTPTQRFAMWGLGLGGLQQLAGFALDLEPLVGVGD
jgi:hypothetical protein